MPMVHIGTVSWMNDNKSTQKKKKKRKKKNMTDQSRATIFNIKNWQNLTWAVLMSVIPTTLVCVSNILQYISSGAGLAMTHQKLISTSQVMNSWCSAIYRGSRSGKEWPSVGSVIEAWRTSIIITLCDLGKVTSHSKLDGGSHLKKKTHCWHTVWDSCLFCGWTRETKHC